jgi:hypothetical protein
MHISILKVMRFFANLFKKSEEYNSEKQATQHEPK